MINLFCLSLLMFNFKIKIMDADIKGCLNQINKSWKAFEYKGKPMNKNEVIKVLQYGLSKGYVSISQISDDEVDKILNK